MPLNELRNKMKVSLTDRSWNEYVGYWDWIKVFRFKTDQAHVSSLKAVCLLSASLRPDWSRERVQTHPGSVPHRLLHPRGRSQSRPLWRTPSSQYELLSQVGRKWCFNNHHLPTRDLDQDADNTTHCANATLLTSASGSTWKRGGWWHAGATGASICHFPETMTCRTHKSWNTEEHNFRD